MRRLLSVLLLIIMSISMTACSSNEIIKASSNNHIKHLPYTIVENTKLNKTNLLDKGKIREKEVKTIKIKEFRNV